MAQFKRSYLLGLQLYTGVTSELLTSRSLECGIYDKKRDEDEYLAAGFIIPTQMFPDLQSVFFPRLPGFIIPTYIIKDLQFVLPAPLH